MAESRELGSGGGRGLEVVGGDGKGGAGQQLRGRRRRRSEGPAVTGVATRVGARPAAGGGGGQGNSEGGAWRRPRGRRGRSTAVASEMRFATRVRAGPEVGWKGGGGDCYGCAWRRRRRRRGRRSAVAARRRVVTPVGSGPPVRSGGRRGDCERGARRQRRGRQAGAALGALREKSACTAVLPKIPHCNSSKSVPNRLLRGRRGRFGSLLEQLECGSFGRTAVYPGFSVPKIPGHRRRKVLSDSREAHSKHGLSRDSDRSSVLCSPVKQPLLPGILRITVRSQEATLKKPLAEKCAVCVLP